METTQQKRTAMEWIDNKVARKTVCRIRNSQIAIGHKCDKTRKWIKKISPISSLCKQNKMGQKIIFHGNFGYNVEKTIMWAVTISPNLTPESQIRTVHSTVHKALELNLHSWNTEDGVSSTLWMSHDVFAGMKELAGKGKINNAVEGWSTRVLARLPSKKGMQTTTRGSCQQHYAILWWWKWISYFEKLAEWMQVF